MFPPTPTPMPMPDEAPIMTNVDAWSFTDPAIQYWNAFPQVGQVVQAVVLLFIIAGIVMILYKQAKDISVIRND